MEEGTGMANLTLESGEIYRPSMIMVMIVIGIHWMFFVIGYGAGSTCTGCIAEIVVWEELSQKIFYCSVVGDQGRVL